jgi:hypothetical protein
MVLENVQNSQCSPPKILIDDHWLTPIFPVCAYTLYKRYSVQGLPMRVLRHKANRPIDDLRVYVR